MKQFKQIYLHMFYQQAGELQFDQKKYIQFLDKSYKINKIIKEDKNLNIDIPNQFVQYCLEHNKQKISNDQILKLMKQSKHYYNISLNNKFNLIVYPFDFNDDTEINSFHYNCFNIKDQKDLDISLKIFKEHNLSKTFGFCNNYENLFICAINTQQNNILQTIYHQLSHFIQQICNIYKTTIKIDLNKNLIQILKRNNISNKDIEYLFNSKQFIPHVDDLCRQMKKIYLNNKFNCSYDFINFIKQEIKKTNIENQLKKELIKLNDFNMQGLILLKSAYLLHFKYEFILKSIERYIV